MKLEELHTPRQRDGHENEDKFAEPRSLSSESRVMNAAAVPAEFPKANELFAADEHTSSNKFGIVYKKNGTSVGFKALENSNDVAYLSTHLRICIRSIFNKCSQASGC